MVSYFYEKLEEENGDLGGRIFVIGEGDIRSPRDDEAIEARF